MSTPDSFETLARSIDSNERNEMLERLNAASRDMTKVNSSFDLPENNTAEVERDLTVNYQSESIILKFWIVLKSLITGSTQEILYNDILVSKKGHEISKTYPELYDYKTGTLLNGMYEQVRHLKLVAEYFKPAVAAYNQNPGEFYVFLGSLLIPELTKEINEESSPFSIPYEREVTGELRLSLIRRLDEILSNLEPGARNVLYQSAQSIDWLSRFCDLPFDKIISRFTSFEPGSYTCPVEILNTDLAALSRVLCHPKSISMELIAAMYYLVSDPEHRNDEDAAKKYRQKSVQQLQALKTFLTVVPLRDITCVAYNSAMWFPDSSGGVEDWFVKFKGHWRKIFDSQWEQWLSDRKKNQVLQTVKKIFNTNQLYLPKYRPWEHVWGGVPFSREYTLGYLQAFFTLKLPELGNLLKRLAIEGAFVLKENRTLCAEMCNELIQQDAAIKAINDKLKPGGVIGTNLLRISGDRAATLTSKTELESIMLNLEGEVALLASRFAGTIREIINIIEGVLQIKRTAKYDTLTNLNEIGGGGAENMKFRGLLDKSHTDFLYALSILREVESIEKAS